MKRVTAAAAATLLALAVGPAAAGEIMFGLGYDGLRSENDGAAAFSAQIHGEPFWHLGPVGFGLGAALEAGSDGDVWGGAGFTAVWPFAEAWRINASLMAGGYAKGDGGDDLGSELQFRSRIGVGYRVAQPWWVGLAVEHKSNAGIGDINPGIETVFATLGREF